MLQCLAIKCGEGQILKELKYPSISGHCSTIASWPSVCSLFSVIFRKYQIPLIFCVEIQLD